jgi:hypothetical protein
MHYVYAPDARATAATPPPTAVQLSEIIGAMSYALDLTEGQPAHTADGRAAALREVRARAGGWFDPELVDAFVVVAQQDGFWTTLGSSGVDQAVLALVPAGRELPLDDDYLDDIAAAFGQLSTRKARIRAGTVRAWRCTPT